MGAVALRLGPWLALALAGWLLLNSQQKIGMIREECETRLASSVAAAEREARETLSEAHQRELAQRDAIIRAERSALRTAREERQRAESDASEANEMIRRLIAEAENDENAPIETVCLTVDVPDDALNGLR